MSRSILVLNGPNLNMLGKREPDIYGSRSLDDMMESLSRFAAEGTPSLDIEHIQSNHEGVLIDAIHERGPHSAGIIINAGAYSHTSVALHDALKSIDTRAIEVHISNIHARETFRHQSTISPAVVGQIAGLGEDGYRLALEWFRNTLAST